MLTVVVSSSGVLAQVTAAGRAVSAAFEPVHHVLQMSTVAAALTPHEQSLHHMVTHGAYTGTLVAPEGETHGSCQSSFLSVREKPTLTQHIQAATLEPTQYTHWSILPYHL